MDNHPSLAWLAPCCEPLAEGASFCPALVPLCSTWGWLLWVGRFFTLQTGVMAQSLAPSLLQMNPIETGLWSWTSAGKWISVEERGVWEPSALPTCAGKVSGWEKKQEKPQGWTLCYFLLLLLSSGQTREHLGLGGSTINGNAAPPPRFSWLVPLCTPVLPPHQG